jgi:soluble P-type ATPase
MGVAEIGLMIIREEEVMEKFEESDLFLKDILS